VRGEVRMSKRRFHTDRENGEKEEGKIKQGQKHRGVRCQKVALSCPMTQGTYAKSLVVVPCLFCCGTTHDPLFLSCGTPTSHGTASMPSFWKSFSWAILGGMRVPLVSGAKFLGVLECFRMFQNFLKYARMF